MSFDSNVRPSSSEQDYIFQPDGSQIVVVRKKSTGKIRRRVVDEDGYIRRVACVCVNEDESQILLVSRKKDNSMWMIPGGGVEASEKETEAVSREAWEEAGVRGHIGRRLGLFESVHPSGTKKHRTSVYVYTITNEEDDFPEAYLGRRRQWFDQEKALLVLTHQRSLQSLYLEFLS